MRRFLYISLCLTLVLVCGCSKKSSVNTQDRSLAQLTGFSFAAVDSMPGLAKASFSIKELLDTGLVENQDSMLYGTSLKRVIPRFSFGSTPDAAYLTFPDETYLLTGADTLDFTRDPIYLTIRSADKSNTKVYRIHPTVHQADPDLYTWTQLNAGIYGEDDSEQRVVELGDDFVMITSHGYSMSVYRSADGEMWTTPASPSGLPAGTKVRQIVSNGTSLFYGQDSTMYSSTDALTWTATKVKHPIVTMLLHWNKQVWALTLNDSAQYELATWSGDSLLMSGLQPGSLFPVSDFGTVTFLSSSLRERAMIIGGFAENGLSLNTRWNLEYSTYIHEHNGYRLEEFSIDHAPFRSLTGISVISYNHQLQLFGGVDDKMTYLGRDILLSTNEGMTWTKADTAKNQLPEAYQARQKQNAIVRDNYIYLFGGQDAKTTYSDVYRGRLNSIDW